MPHIRSPRHGSMQYWPRKRSKNETARVRNWPSSKDAKSLGFAGYKAGMTHILITDNRKKTLTKGETISVPVTIIECPPIKAIGVRAYNIKEDGKFVATEVIVSSDKELGRRLSIPKKNKGLENIEKDIESFSDIVLIVQTQPKLTGIGKKKPEVFEIGIGSNNNKEKLDYIKGIVGKEIKVTDVFEPGSVLDIKSVTTGKGFQGPVKRFGVSIRARKSEKTKRGPGSLGGWIAQGHSMYRISHAGQTGYHARTEYNKQILAISDNPEDINQKGGIQNYGVVKNPFILIKGSIGGPKKRLIRLNAPMRVKNKLFPGAPEIKKIIK